jgi:hypothetical protein
MKALNYNSRIRIIHVKKEILLLCTAAILKEECIFFNPMPFMKKLRIIHFLLFGPSLADVVKFLFVVPQKLSLICSAAIYEVLGHFFS